MRLNRAMLCVVLGCAPVVAVACEDDEVFPQAMVTLEAGSFDVNVPIPEAGAPDGACAIQGALQALGADAGGEVLAHDFTCAQGLDLGASTATLDFAGTGFARALAARSLPSAGDGGGGAYASDGGQPVDGGVTPLQAGVHALTSFDLANGTLFVNGNLTLAVAGPLSISNDANLQVQGDLVLVASGHIKICGLLEAAGDVKIFQPTNAGITFGCGDTAGGVSAGVTSGPLTTTSSGDIELATRGPMGFASAYMSSSGYGVKSPARSGSITLRAYGDITLGAAGIGPAPDTNAYFNVGGSCPAGVGQAACDQGTIGDIRLLSEGTVSLTHGSYMYTPSAGAKGGDISIRGAAGVRFDDSSRAYTGRMGSVDIVSQGDVTFDKSSYSFSGNAPSTKLSVRARALSMKTSSFAYTRGASGDLSVATVGDITIDTSSFMYTGTATCAPAGNLRLESQGKIAITNGAFVYAGDSTSDVACAAAAGGSVIVRARGAVVAPVPDGGAAPVTGGAGAPNGTVTQTPNAPVSIGVLDVQLEPSLKVVSASLPAAAGSLVFGSLGATEPQSFFGAHLLVSPDGTPAGFAPVGDVSGNALPAGWRYEVLVQPRMFDPSAVDGLVIRTK